jgi:pimeloyl-ACP methyl ester carboxylesterase
MKFLCGVLFIAVSFISSAVAQEPIARLTKQSSTPCSMNCPKSAVIFVHGITGSKTTWGDPDSALYFPKMIASEPSLKDDVDVYQIDYDSKYTQGPATVAIGDTIASLLDKLMLEKKYTNVMFVAHSLGGIITRQYLLHVANLYGHTALSRMRLVVTLGTPYTGSSLAKLGAFATENEQIRVLQPLQVNDYAQLLNATNWAFLQKHEYCPSLRNFSGFEMKPYGLLGIIVDEESATEDAAGKMGFNRNHLELPKPVSDDDEVFRWTADLIRKCIRNDDSVCKAAALNPNCPDVPQYDFRPLDRHR